MALVTVKYSLCCSTFQTGLFRPLQSLLVEVGRGGKSGLGSESTTPAPARAVVLLRPSIKQKPEYNWTGSVRCTMATSAHRGHHWPVWGFKHLGGEPGCSSQRQTRMAVMVMVFLEDPRPWAVLMSPRYGASACTLVVENALLTGLSISALLQAILQNEARQLLTEHRAQ